jgi:hypothetical protein
MSEQDLFAAYGRFYSRVGLKLGWTIANHGNGAKRASERGAGGWKAARALAREPEAAAGFMAERCTRRSPVIPAVANELVLFDFDDGPLDELRREHGLEALPAGAWRVNTVDGAHFYAAAPPGRAGCKLELTPGRATFSVDGYLLAPPGRHPDGLRYTFTNVDLKNGDGRPPILPVRCMSRCSGFVTRGARPSARRWTAASRSESVTGMSRSATTPDVFAAKG